MKEKLYKLLLAAIAALFLSVIQFWAAIYFSMNILWQAQIMLLLVGPGPILGYDSSGKPLYEGTPVHMVAAYFGLFFGFIIYTAIFYLLISRKWHNTYLLKAK
jgi:hypothetical protein